MATSSLLLGIWRASFWTSPRAALASIKQALRSSYGRNTQDGVDEQGDLFANLIAQDERCVDMMRDYVAGGHQQNKF